MYRKNNLKLYLSMLLLSCFSTGVYGTSSMGKTAGKVHGRDVAKAKMAKTKMAKKQMNNKAVAQKMAAVKKTVTAKKQFSKPVITVKDRLIAASKAAIKNKQHIQSTSPKKVTLDYSLRKAINTHPSVLSSFYGFKATKERLSAARGAFLPSLNLSTSYQLNKDPSSFFSGGQSANASEPKTDATTNITTTTVTPTSSSGFRITGGLDYNLFSSFKDIWALSKADSNSKAAVVDYHGAKLNIANETGSSYIDVRRLQRLTALYKETVDVHQQFLKKVKTRVNAGQLASDAVDATISKLEEAQQALITARSNFATNRVTLQAAIGEQNVAVANAKIDDKLIPSSLGHAAALMQTHHVEILKARHAYEVAKYNYKETVAGNGPTLNLSFETSYTSDDNGYAGQFSALAKTRRDDGNGNVSVSQKEVDTSSSDFSVSLTGDMSVTGGMFSDIAAAAAERKQAYYNMLAQGLKAKAELEIAWLSRTEARKKVDSLMDSVSSKKRLMDRQIKKFDLNRANLISVLLRIEEYNRDKARLISAQADLDKSELALLALHTGTAISALKI